MMGLINRKFFAIAPCRISSQLWDYCDPNVYTHGAIRENFLHSKGVMHIKKPTTEEPYNPAYDIDPSGCIKPVIIVAVVVLGILAYMFFFK